jgi:hypothetical protein
LESHDRLALGARVRHPGVWLDRVYWIDRIHRVDGINRIYGFDWLDGRHVRRGVGCGHGIYRWYDGQREQHQLSCELVDAG